jgi:ketosteroid isomerase-like protein
MSQARETSVRKLLWVCFAIAATGLAGAVAASERTADEQAVWKLEEDYWWYVQAGDVESYVELWHEDFVGWPCHTKTPSDKSGIGSWVTDIRDNQWKFDNDYGDGTKSGAGIWRKFVHVWKKAGDRWQIITGMCAAQEPVAAPRS